MLSGLSSVWDVSMFNHSLHERFWGSHQLSRNQYIATLKKRYYNTSILETLPDFHKLIVNISKLMRKRCLKKSFVQYSLISDPYGTIINSPYISIDRLDTLKVYHNLSEILKINNSIGINKLIVSYD